MRLQSRLMLSAVMLLGSVTLVAAQSFPNDSYDDKILSYGPKPVTSSPRVAPTRRAPIADRSVNSGPSFKGDSYDDKTLSYGAISPR
jgi:hypothetical protein